MPLQEVWKQFLEARALQLVLRGRIILVEARMQSIDCYYGVKRLGKMLRQSDDLSKTIQNPDLVVTD